MKRHDSFTATLLIAMLAGVATAAPFTSGSTGVDGPLDFPVGDGSPRTVVFDPATNVPPVDVDGDGVYHFTTVTIPQNVTVRLRADKCGFKPLFWLASGAVNIAGTLDLSGEDPTEFPAGTITYPTIPGPGGFPGGVASVSPETLGSPGFGPGGGIFQGYEGSHATGGAFTFFNPTVYGTEFLVPLIGGSGGAGGPYPQGTFTTVFTGGAGGGAILIASDLSIVVSGTVNAQGGISPGRAGEPNGGDGQGGFSGDGAGGAIRLMAPSVVGSGSLIAGHNDFRFFYGGLGRVRIESNDPTEFTGTIVGVSRRVTLHPGAVLGLPSQVAPPRISAVRIAGQNVPVLPSGAFTPPDVAIGSDQPVLVELEARNIPLDATVTLYLFSEGQLLAPLVADPLVGTAASSTATLSATFPAGLSKGIVTATWTPQ
ncbi:hypothetical protein GC173_07600 [bacterium]|nr:hypothetical protein [bacterium]